MLCGKDKIGSEVPPSSLRLTRQLPVPPLPLNQLFKCLVLALAVLKPVYPIPLVILAISICHVSPAFPPALLVLTLVLIPIQPAVLSLAMFLILAPLPNICLSSI